MFFRWFYLNYMTNKMTSLEPLPDNVVSIQRSLDFVGNISTGQKLYFKKMMYVGRWDFFKIFSRFMDKEDRNYTLENLKIIFRTYIYIKLNPTKYDTILDYSFVKFYKGVKILCETYQEPEYFKFYKMIEEYNSTLL